MKTFNAPYWQLKIASNKLMLSFCITAKVAAGDVHGIRSQQT
jgi:hypothetical protein